MNPVLFMAQLNNTVGGAILVTSGYRLSFGAYVFPHCIAVSVSSVDSSRQVPSAKLPRRDGARTLRNTLQLKKFSVRGMLIRAAGSKSPTELRGILDPLKAAVGSGFQNFTTDIDRYYRLCQVENYSDTYDPTSWNRYVDIAFDIVSGDPFSYEVAGQSVSSGGTSLSITNGGNAPAAPMISLTASSTGALAATVTNITTGDVFTISGSVTAGDVIAVDSLLMSVTRAGGDVISMFEGLFPALAVGANTISVSVTAGSVASVAAVWNNRYF